MSYCSVCFLALGSRLSAAVVQLVSLKLHPSANRCCRQEVQANLPGEVRYVPTMQSWRVWFGIGDILGCPRSAEQPAVQRTDGREGQRRPLACGNYIRHDPGQGQHHRTKMC